MHAAPSVSYPVGRSAFAAALHAAVCLLAAAAAGAWTFAADAPGWPHALAWAAVLGCAGFAFGSWLRSPAGMLRWDGAGWQWQDARGTMALALDLQSRLLLRWRGETGGTRWLWIEQESDFAHWDALRRAVYSRADASVPTFSRGGKESLPDGKPPAAEQ